MGVEDDPIVMVFLCLPAPEVAAVDEIDVHAGEAKLESPVNADSGRGGAMKDHGPEDSTPSESAPETPVEAGFANGFPVSKGCRLTSPGGDMDPKTGHRLGQDGKEGEAVCMARGPANVPREGDRGGQRDHVGPKVGLGERGIALMVQRPMQSDALVP